MDLPISGPPVSLSRRQLLRWAGGAGLAAALTGCSDRALDQQTGAPAAKVAAGPSPSSAAPVAPKDEPAPAKAVVAPLLCRDAWGARAARAGGVTHTITRMTLHHSGVVLPDNRTITDRLRQHQSNHQDQRGWIDIAYHIGIDHDGNIFELRPIEYVGDTATDYDPTGHFLVLCEGDFDQEPVPDAQLHSAAVVFAWAAQTYRISTDTLAGHRDFAATACPGGNLYAHLSSGDLRQRVDELVAAGPVELRRVCGDEAAAMVAGIEAGR